MSHTLLNASKNKVLAERLKVASNFPDRMKGLLGKKSLAKEEALWIKQCNSIHTFFMQFNIDVVFVDKSLVVKKVLYNLPPWRLILPVWRADSVVEFVGGKLNSKDVEIGDQLNVGH